MASKNTPHLRSFSCRFNFFKTRFFIVFPQKQFVRHNTFLGLNRSDDAKTSFCHAECQIGSGKTSILPSASQTRINLIQSALELAEALREIRQGKNLETALRLTRT